VNTEERIQAARNCTQAFIDSANEHEAEANLVQLGTLHALIAIAESLRSIDVTLDKWWANS
jgi:hypothetical protein